MDLNTEAIEIHTKLKGKISTSLRATPNDKHDLSLFYSPGVGAVAAEVANNPEKLSKVTWTNNLVAVISDGSAVLGLGNIGPRAAMPVMEGKSMLFKHFAGIDSVPIVLDVHTADEIVAAVCAIAPSFGGINLEDIAAPICFEVEDRLKALLPIPVMHDDQHGTAIVTLAGLINATKVVNKELRSLKIVLVGAGAAGVAIAKLLYAYAKPTIIAVDSKGVIHKDRDDLTLEKKLLLEFSSVCQVTTLEEALVDADVFIGVSKPGLLTAAMIKTMAKDPIIFAMANPIPEIMPDEAKAAGAVVVATGRSDFPNQVNNSLGFPGIFRGALDHGVKTITEVHKIAAAEALAGLVTNPSADFIVPSPFDENVVPAIAQVIV